MKELIEEKHKELYGPRNKQARGYAERVVQSMDTFYDKVAQSAEYDQLMSMLNPQKVHSLRDQLFPDGKACLNPSRYAVQTISSKYAVLILFCILHLGFAHVKEAEDAAAAQAEAAAEAQRLELTFGVDMPPTAGDAGLISNWIDQFINSNMQDSGKGVLRFKDDLERQVCKDIYSRTCHWANRTELDKNLKTKIQYLQKQMFLAFRKTFS